MLAGESRIVAFTRPCALLQDGMEISGKRRHRNGLGHHGFRQPPVGDAEPDGSGNSPVPMDLG